MSKQVCQCVYMQLNKQTNKPKIIRGANGNGKKKAIPS